MQVNRGTGQGVHDPRCPDQIPHPRTLPLWPLNHDLTCSCGRGPALCKQRDAGKHRLAAGRQPLPGGGYGIYCGAAPRGSGIFVVDLDFKPELQINGLESWEEIHRRLGLPLPETLTVRTGGNGFHYYFLHPGLGKTIKASSHRLGKGIDIKGDGGEKDSDWVVGPGSMHRSGLPYRISNHSPIAPAPEWLLAWPELYHQPKTLDVDPSIYASLEVDMCTAEGLRRAEAFRSECAGEVGNFAPSVEGHHGSDRLLVLASRGACYWLLPPGVVAEIIALYFNPRCSPPWQEYDIQRKVQQAIATNRDLPVGPMPVGWGDELLRSALVGQEAASAPIVTEIRTADPQHQYGSIVVGHAVAAGKLGPMPLTNIVNTLCRSVEWRGVLYSDEFSGVVRAVNPPLALDAERDPAGLSDRDVDAICIWFEAVHAVGATKELMVRAITTAAKTIKSHPVREYLNRLPKGDVGLFDTLALQLFGSDDPLDTELLKKFLVAAVRRVLRPGTQVDTMLVLFGETGFKKSQFIRTLFGYDWSSSQMPDLTSKDASGDIAAIWGQEIGELDKFLRVDPATAKDYISRCVDRYRPVYQRFTVSKPRSVVFVGTTNASAFLRDPTGERRYWVMRVLRVIDLEWVAAMRDSIWAAALALAADKSFEHWINQGSELDGLLKARQAPFADSDAWMELVLDYCAGRETVTALEVYRTAIMKDDPQWAAKFDRRTQTRIADLLRRLGSVVVQDGAVHRHQLPLDVSGRAPSVIEVRRRAAAETPYLRQVGP